MVQARPSEQPVRRVFPNEAAELIRKGEAIPVDVRTPDEYAAAHLPGARSIPLAGLAAALPNLPRDRVLIFYCT